MVEVVRAGLKPGNNKSDLATVATEDGPFLDDLPMSIPDFPELSYFTRG